MAVPIPERFRLYESDKISTTWARIERHLKEQLADLRVQNDGQLDETKTAHLRGRIAQIKDLLRAADEVLPPIES